MLSETRAAEAIDAAAVDYSTEEVVVGGSRVHLKQEPEQIIPIDKTGTDAKPSLDAALKGHSNIQVVPTLLHGTNVSLNGVNGEQVALYQDGDPLLGRIEGALDARTVSLGVADRIAVYQGLDSLPYGNQNIGGVISLESPWEAEKKIKLKSAAGSFGQTVLEGQAGTASKDQDWNASISASQWRNDAIRNDPDKVDTLLPASAHLSAAAQASKERLFEKGGRSLDVRLGGDGLNENDKSILAGQRMESDQRRVHLFTDARYGDSVFHVSFTDYRNRYRGLSSNGENERDDLYTERAVRFGSQIQEHLGNWTFLGGGDADLHATASSRIPGGELSRSTFGVYAGARYAFSEHWSAGGGSRWDSGPRLASPRAEIKYSFDSSFLGQTWEHATTLESGLGFREVSPKEQYLDFTNPAFGYRIIGNPALKNERAWMTAVRHKIFSKKASFSASVFQTRVTDAIAYQASGAVGVWTYANLHAALTQGAQAGMEWRWPLGLSTRVDYQWLRGRNLENNGELFLQPRHRAAFSLGREEKMGFGGAARAVWTSRQVFADTNRNGLIDDSEWADSYWMASLEGGYGFRWGGVSELVRFFARMDNAFNTVHAETFPLEPRSFLVGAAFEL